MKKCIACFGEVLVDIIISKDFTLTPVTGGSVYNTANSLSKLGSKARFYSHIGADFWGKFILDQMDKDGIDHSGLDQSSINKTPLAFAVIDEAGNAKYDFYKTKISDKLTIGDLSDVGIFHFGSYYSVLRENRKVINSFISALKMHDSIVSYDPNYRSNFAHKTSEIVWNFKRASIIKASFDDISSIFGVKTLDAAFTALEKYKPILTIITLGDEGAAAKITGSNYIKSAGKLVNVADSIGAGDNFSAGYLSFLYENKILTNKALREIDSDFIKKMLDYANNVAAESLLVKGANVGKEKLIDIKNKFIAG